MNYGIKILSIAMLVASGFLGASVPARAQTVDETIASARRKFDAGDPSSALADLKAASAKSPSDARLHYWAGRIYYLQGNYRAAIAELAGTAGKIPADESEQATQMLGLGNYILGQLADAIPHLEKVVSRQPDNGEIVYALGVCYVQTRQPDKSRAAFAKLFKVDPASAAAYLLNAKMHVRQQFEETAEIELKKALELDPKLPEVRFSLGELAVYRADIERGVELFKQEIALNPSSGMAYYRLGEAYTRLLKWDEAIPVLQRSIWINPFFSGPYIVLGKAYLKKKELPNAESLLRRATTIDPNNYGAHYLLAQTLQQLGRADDAKAEFALAEKLRSTSDKEP